MTPETILEIARRFTVPKEESSLLVEFNSDDVPTPTGETLNLMMWNFCEEELTAFVQSVIEADRESGDEPVGWLYERCDNPDVYVSPDAAFSWFQEGRYTIPLYTRPSPVRKPLSDDEIDDGMNEFVKWMKAQDPEVIRDPFSAAAGWAAGQKAERERIKKIIYEATDGGRGNYELLIERID